MKVKDFIKKYYNNAIEAQNNTGLSAIAILSQCALETGWGLHCPNNMMFGIKANKEWEGKRQLVLTTEYHDNPDVKYPAIVSVNKVGENRYFYRVKDWFRAYNNPTDSFIDHTNLIKNKERYKKAWSVRENYNKFFEEIHKAGYSTSPNYSETLKKIAKMITNNL